MLRANRLINNKCLHRAITGTWFCKQHVKQHASKFLQDMYWLLTCEQTIDNPQLIFIHIHQLFRTQCTSFLLDTANIYWWWCINFCRVDKRRCAKASGRCCARCPRRPPRCSAASKRGQDKHYFYRSAINCQNVSITMA